MNNIPLPIISTIHMFNVSKWN